MTRDELVTVLRARDALTAAAAADRRGAVRILRGGDAEGVFVDADGSATIDAHRAAHRAGRPSVAGVPYGEGVAVETTADRLVALAALASETGMLTAVCAVPATGERTPGSWGVEDLTVIAACRRALDPSVRVRPDWARIGAQACGVALAFGADELAVPADDRTDLDTLIGAAGRTAA